MTNAVVRIESGESIDGALRRLKKKLDKVHLFGTLRARERYEKPSERRRRKRNANRRRTAKLKRLPLIKETRP